MASSIVLVLLAGVALWPHEGSAQTGRCNPHTRHACSGLTAFRLCVDSGSGRARPEGPEIPCRLWNGFATCYGGARNLQEACGPPPPPCVHQGLLPIPGRCEDYSVCVHSGAGHHEQFLGACWPGHQFSARQSRCVPSGEAGCTSLPTLHPLTEATLGHPESPSTLPHVQPLTTARSSSSPPTSSTTPAALVTDGVTTPPQPETWSRVSEESSFSRSSISADTGSTEGSVHKMVDSETSMHASSVRVSVSERSSFSGWDSTTEAPPLSSSTVNNSPTISSASQPPSSSITTSSPSSPANLVSSLTPSPLNTGLFSSSSTPPPSSHVTEHTSPPSSPGFGSSVTPSSISSSSTASDSTTPPPSSRVTENTSPPSSPNLLSSVTPSAPSTFISSDSPSSPLSPESSASVSEATSASVVSSPSSGTASTGERSTGSAGAPQVSETSGHDPCGAPGVRPSDRFPDMSSCRRYFTCRTDGARTHVTCPARFWFDPATQACARNVECGSRPL